ncbi:MAG: hypothetical protein KF752_14005 [Pirellulaceae bacterium]|nr:hypothetical protein [Pirellulaceae bacterium]
MKSQYFSALALRGLRRVGDIMIPGDEQFPSYTHYGGIEHIDKFAAFVPEGDRQALNWMMTLLGLAPRFILRWLVNRAVAAHQSSGPLAGVFRMIYYGWWGLIHGSYYSNRPGSSYQGLDPVDIIHFRLNRVTD